VDQQTATNSKQQQANSNRQQAANSSNQRYLRFWLPSTSYQK
jgi:hypothetical protein